MKRVVTGPATVEASVNAGWLVGVPIGCPLAGYMTARYTTAIDMNWVLSVVMFFGTWAIMATGLCVVTASSILTYLIIKRKF